MFIGLAYHSVSDSDYRYAVSPAQFERELLALKSRGAEFARVSELRGILEKRSDRGRLVACVTFDDGLEDNYTVAFPVLKRLGIPGTIYMATDYVGKLHGTGGYKFQFLNWEQMREMQKSGLVEIGNHTHAHLELSAQNEDDIERDIKRAHDEIAQNLGTPPVSIAYPKGLADKRVRGIAAKYAQLAFAGEGVLRDRGNMDLYALPRITIVNGLSPARFRFMCSPWYGRAKRLKNFILTTPRL